MTSDRVVYHLQSDKPHPLSLPNRDLEAQLLFVPKVPDPLPRQFSSRVDFIRTLFSPFGELLHVLTPPIKSRTNSYYAYVRFARPADASAAAAHLHTSFNIPGFEGRPFSVTSSRARGYIKHCEMAYGAYVPRVGEWERNEAEMRERQRQREQEERAGPWEVRVEGLSRRTSRTDLREWFEGYMGTRTQDVSLCMSNDCGDAWAQIVFFNRSDRDHALRFDGQHVLGRTVRVRISNAVATPTAAATATASSSKQSVPSSSSSAPIKVESAPDKMDVNTGKSASASAAAASAVKRATTSTSLTSPPQASSSTPHIKAEEQANSNNRVGSKRDAPAQAEAQVKAEEPTNSTSASALSAQALALLPLLGPLDSLAPQPSPFTSPSASPPLPNSLPPSTLSLLSSLLPPSHPSPATNPNLADLQQTNAALTSEVASLRTRLASLRTRLASLTDELAALKCTPVPTPHAGPSPQDLAHLRAALNAARACGREREKELERVRAERDHAAGKADALGGVVVQLTVAAAGGRKRARTVDGGEEDQGMRERW